MSSLNTIIVAGMAATHLAVSGNGLFTTNGWWNQDTVGMHASANSFPVGNSFRNALGPSFGFFNKNPSQFRLNINYDDNSVSRANWESEIWATSSWNWDPAPAAEFSRYGLNGRIKASDIIFNNNGATWTTSETATNLMSYGGAGRSFQGALLHELGHTAGLGHEDDEYNVMGEEWMHVHRWQDRVRPYMGEDAADGLVSIYGARSGESIEDLGATHFKWVDRDGEYSEHFRTLMYSQGGSELGFNAFSGMRRYNVNAGQTVQVEFTYENNGETSKSNIPIGFYISTNSLITTGDRLIATQTFNLSRGDVATRTDTVTIPSDLAPGQTYYLGVIVDRTNTFPEIDEDNNRAFHIIRIN
jgi:hypothetical protein